MHSITLTVVDEDGAVDWDTVTITVRAMSVYDFDVAVRQALPTGCKIFEGTSEPRQTRMRACGATSQHPAGEQPRFTARPPRVAAMWLPVNAPYAARAPAHMEDITRP